MTEPVGLTPEHRANDMGSTMRRRSRFAREVYQQIVGLGVRDVSFDKRGEEIITGLPLGGSLRATLNRNPQKRRNMLREIADKPGLGWTGLLTTWGNDVPVVVIPVDHFVRLIDTINRRETSS